MSEKKVTRTYKVIRGLINAFYPKMETVGAENQEPVIIVGNHSQLHGPLACELRFPGEKYIWCAAQMMHRKEVAAYAFEDFWSQKPKWTHPFYKLLSHLIVPLSVCIFNNAHTIGVYRDVRVMSTFKETIHRLDEGANVIVFPEHDVKHNHIVYDFQQNFVDVAKLYYRRTGKELAFVPMYIAPKLRRMILGEPIRFNHENPIEQERKRICAYCMEHITQLAEAQELHTVIPYRNIPKKLYPTNRPK